MPLDTLAALSAEVVDWLDDPSLAARVPTFVTLAEKTLERRLDLAENEVQTRLDLVAGRAPLPDDYGSVRAVNGARGYPLDYVPPHVFLAQFGRGYGMSSTGQGDGYDDVAAEPGYGGRPALYTILGSIPLDDIDVDVSIWPNGLDRPFLLTGPAYDGQVSLVYRQGLPPLSAANPTNWLLRKAPDLYLYAVLLEFAPYLRDDDRLALWEGKLAQKIDDIQTLDRRARYGRGAIRTLEPTP